MTLGIANLAQVALISVSAMGLVLTASRPRLRALAALLAMSILWMVFNFLEERAGFREIWLVTPAFRLAYPPLFFLFTRALVFRGEALSWRDAPHAIPFLLALGLTWQLDWVETAARISMLAYIIAAIILVHRFHRASRHLRSDARQIRLYGLYGVVAVYLIDEGFDVLRMDLHAAHRVWPWLASEGAYAVSLLISTVITVSAILLAVRRQTLFEGLSSGALDQANVETDADAAAGDAAAFERLDALVRRDALYTEPRLTRAELAIAAGLAEREVTRIVKAATGRTFNDYINALRIEDVRQMLDAKAQGQSDMTVLDIAYTAGFSSKSAFNDVFKRETGQTPSAWLRRAAPEAAAHVR